MIRERKQNKSQKKLKENILFKKIYLFFIQKNQLIKKIIKKD